MEQVCRWVAVLCNPEKLARQGLGGHGHATHAVLNCMRDVLEPPAAEACSQEVLGDGLRITLRVLLDLVGGGGVREGGGGGSQ